jgi:hypothetical protein
MLMMFNAADWYWQIMTNANFVYASKRNIYVDPATDSAYSTWKAVNGGAAAPQVANEADVWYYMQNVLPPWLWNGTTMSQPAIGQYTKPQLSAYNATARYNRASGGCTITGKPYLTDPVSRNTVGSAHDYAVANPGHITDWKLADGTFTQLSASQLANVLQQMATFVQSCFTTESANLTSINGATITTPAQIDNAFAAISNVFS